MATKTTNLKLTKPHMLEYADVSVINANMDIVDHVIGDLAELSTDAKNNLVDAINEAAETGGQDGPPGPQGPAGPQGPQGIEGPRGQDGAGLAIIDFFDTLAELTATITNPNPGDAYGVGTAAPFDVYVYGLSSGWTNNGQLTGPEGPIGPQGPAGIQGSQGDTGAQGPQGDAGAQGPKGDTGVQGPQGDTGPQGPQGPGVDMATIINLIYPVDSIYMAVNPVNPGTFLPGTTWTQWGVGRVPVGVNTADADFNTVEKEGGEKSNNYSQNTNVLYSSPTSGLSGRGRSSNQAITTGSSFLRAHLSGTSLSASWVSTAETATHAIYTTVDLPAVSTLQPYITCYMWKRTA
jgi:Collagen triple helix repeat (20 copies).